MQIDDFKIIPIEGARPGQILMVDDRVIYDFLTAMMIPDEEIRKAQMNAAMIQAAEERRAALLRLGVGGE